MPIDFPNTPSINQSYTVGTSTWVWDGSTWLRAGSQYGNILFTTASTLVTGTGKARFYMSRAGVIRSVIASVNTAPTGASILVDVNKNGTTIYSTQGNRPTIAVSTFVDTSSPPDITTFVANDYFTVDIDQVGSTITGSDLVVQIEYELF